MQRLNVSVLAIGATLLLAGSAAAQGPPPSSRALPPDTNSPQVAQAEPTNEEQQRHAAALEAIALELRAIREQAARAEDRQTARDREPVQPIWSNWVLIVVTAAAVGAAYMSLAALRKQVDAGLIAARANEASAKTAAKQMYLSLRARLGASGFSFMGFSPTSERNLITIEVENFGGKGALVVDIAVGVAIGQLPPTPVLPPATSFEAPLERGAKFVLDVDRELPLPKDPIWETVASGETPLHVFGRIRYQAGFGTKTRSMGFCRQFTAGSTGNHSHFSVSGGKPYNYAE